MGNSPVTGEFPAHMASNAENVSIWWRHHGPNAIEVSMKDRGKINRYQPATKHNNAYISCDVPYTIP